MVVNKVSSRYAKSLISLAMEQKCLEEVRSDMNTLVDIFSQSADLVILLKSPVINAQKKEIILSKIFDGKLNLMTSKFISILVKKGRESYLPGIAQAFITHYDLVKGISKAEITTAYPMDEETRKAMRGLIGSMMTENKEIHLEESVKPELIGGFIARLNDKQIDASLRRKIEDIKKELNENPYIAEF
jgi:F-type H+-transporting ATPase subunit delta